MRYSEETDEFSLSVREFVGVARRGIARALPFDEDEPEHPDRRAALRLALPEGAAEAIGFPFEMSGMRLRLFGSADAVEDDALTFVTVTEANPEKPPRELVSEARAEAFVLALGYAMIRTLPAVRLTFLYVNVQTGAIKRTEETVSVRTLRAFFDKCLPMVTVFAEPEMHRVKFRLPTLRTLAFPYGHVREGQSELASAVYRAVSRGGVLVAQAPTGTGKTVSALFPALRAMGAGKCEKIFYFTPKTTTLTAVADCLDRLSAAGACVRAVSLYGKDRICPHALACRVDRDSCPKAKNNRLAEAALALFHTEKTLIVKEDLLSFANEYNVCPHELSLCYAEIADVVVGDFNYLFDPDVYLHRFFDEGGKYAFLVDEAHNLPDRAVEMYSDTLSAKELYPDAIGIPAQIPAADAIGAFAAYFETVFYSYVKEELRRDKDGAPIGAAHTRALPADIYEKLNTVLLAIEDGIFSCRKRGDAYLPALRQFYYRLRRFSRVAERFDDRYECFVFFEGGELSVRLCCLDPGRDLGERLAKGQSAVFFSGTLTPTEYYRYVLTGANTAATLTVSSPFVREQVCVSIMDNISTRYSERERNLPAVLRVIAATVSAKRGHYIVFSPSMAYNAALAAAFRQKYPKVKSIEQRAHPSDDEKRAFLRALCEEEDSYLVAFCVMGGLYAEGIDLAGGALLGAIIVGTGMPALSYEREAMAAYYDEKFDAGKQYAYIYPGLNRVFQAAGRVIRREEDRGVIVLIDDRFADPLYKKNIPELWHGLKFVREAKGLKMLVDRFWRECEAETADGTPGA